MAWSLWKGLGIEADRFFAGTGESGAVFLVVLPVVLLAVAGAIPLYFTFGAALEQVSVGLFRLADGAVSRHFGDLYPGLLRRGVKVKLEAESIPNKKYHPYFTPSTSREMKIALLWPERFESNPLLSGFHECHAKRLTFPIGIW